MDGRADEANVTIDFGAVSEGFNVCGIDTPGVSQVTCSEDITHWKPFKNISSRSKLHWTLAWLRPFTEEKVMYTKSILRR